jgi:hypothetical protein
MISRRRFIGASAAALAVPLAGGVRPPRASAATQASPAGAAAARAAATTAATLGVNLQNNTGSDTVYAYVTGQALDNGSALMLLESDGQTPYYPASPAATGSPLAVDCAIPLGASGGAPTPVTIPTWPAPGSGSLSAARWSSCSILAPPWSSPRSPTRPTPTSACSGTSAS